MKKVVDYFFSPYQMGDLLQSENVSIRNDFSDAEQENLRKYLEEYMSGSYENKSIQIDLKKFCLILRGADEADYLYEYVK